jgi:hypothetical protein
MLSDIKHKLISDTKIDLLPFSSKNFIITAVINLISKIRVLLLIVWVGSAVFFSFVVAPSVFGLVPSRETAGSVVSRSLMILNYSGLMISFILLLSSFIYDKGISIWFERLLLFIVFITTAIGQFVISLQLSQIRNQAGRPIEELSMDEPLRIAFNSLHEYSVWVLITGMIAALIAFFLMSPVTSPPKNNDLIDQFGNIKI